LGVVNYRDYRSFIVADIPGIIEGASEGRGLGHRFLRHIERNAALLFLIPADSADHKTEYMTLLSELEKFNPELVVKQRIVAVSKADMLDDELKQEIRAQLKGVDVLFFSSVTEQGVGELLDVLWKTVSADV
jgi:GTP-binding protein